jgi:hypothetical protein
MQLKIHSLLCMIVLVSISCGKSAKAKCKEVYFAYKKDFPNVSEIKDTITLNACLYRVNEALACAQPSDYEYPFLEMDKKILGEIKPRIIRETPRNYSVEQLNRYAHGLQLRLDSTLSNHYFIATSYSDLQLITDGVTLDGTIEYKANDFPRIELELRFESRVNGSTVHFIELQQGEMTYREDNFILVDSKSLSDFSSDPLAMLLGTQPTFQYGTCHPTFETNELFAGITADLPLTVGWGNDRGTRETTISNDQVKEFERLVNVFERMRTGQP